MLKYWFILGFIVSFSSYNLLGGTLSSNDARTKRTFMSIKEKSREMSNALVKLAELAPNKSFKAKANRAHSTALNFAVFNQVVRRGESLLEFKETWDDVRWD